METVARRSPPLSLDALRLVLQKDGRDVTTTLALCSLGLVVYTYAGYPILIAVLARLFPLHITVQEGWEPKVTVCIPTYNSMGWLRDKLETIGSQTYPQDKIEVLVYSDGASDGTNDMVRAWALDHPGVHLLAAERRAGKPTALNRMIAQATGELLIMTDSRQTLEPETVRETVRAMSDPAVGAASGHITLNGNRGSSLYWRYDSWIRRSEGGFRSTSGATGMYYAIRRTDVEPIPADTILDDMWIAMSVRLRGKKLLYAERARVRDVAFDDNREFNRKVRTLAGSYQHFAREPKLLVPFVNPSWFETFSHRILRLVCPWAMLALVGAALVGVASDVEGPELWFLRVLAAGSLVLGLLALVGSRAGPAAGVARTFVVMNIAAVVGLYRWAAGRQAITW